uniref:Uncharacterized protein n=1 Tax=Rhizophora mucronata TaxID=61149 RepID=A0A2P2QPK9_RHIMU
MGINGITGGIQHQKRSCLMVIYPLFFFRNPNSGLGWCWCQRCMLCTTIKHDFVCMHKY